jgi:peptide deformylase
MRQILTLENGRDVLRGIASPVNKVTPQIRELVDEMFRLMRDGEGIGLAAPQVGESLRLIVFETGDDRGALIDPVITSQEGSEVASEGCLSLPNLNGDVERATEVTVRFVDENGKKRTQTWRDLAARVVQHEIDHLDGVLFTDRAVKGTLHLVEPEAEGGEEAPAAGHERERVEVL